MHWSRVKTILIFLFLALDILMLGYVLYMDYDPYAASKSEIRDIINICRANNLEVSEKIIPQKSEKLSITELNNLWTDKTGIAKNFMSQGFTAETDNKFSQGGKTLEIYNNRLIYKNTDVNPEENVKLNEFLNEFHISTDEECFSGDTVCQEINGRPVFESAVTVKGGSGGISELSGYWIISDNFSRLQKRPVKLKPIPGVLFDFLSTNAYKKTGDKIVLIETGYSTGSAETDTVHKLISVRPAYKITAESGGYAVFDATDGGLLYEFIGTEG